jgi:exopolyphosphatase/guanosine-5'-triphosphate,3'-diphosphate pyrophosphatase
MDATPIATIDLGTNTFSCLVARPTEEGPPEVLADLERLVGLGEGLDQSGVISEAAMGRADVALQEFVDVIRKHGATRMYAVGTQAMREARNARDFLRRAQTTLGMEIEVVSGVREAELTYRAVVMAFPNLRTDAVGLDIGAGSTELMVGRGRDLKRATSMPIGSVRLTERLLKTDPPDEAQIARLEGAIDGAFVREALPGRCTFIAVAGTATTLLQVIRGKSQSADELEGGRIKVHDLDALVKKLAAMPLADRYALPGMVAGRAPYLLAGGTILLRVVKRTLSTEIIVSGHGVRWGLLYDRFIDRWPVIKMA